MQKNYLPISIYPSTALHRIIGPDFEKIAGLALREVLKNRRSLEIAHQQVAWKNLTIAFSSRITTSGNLIIELDIGDPRLKDRIILEEDMHKGRGAGDKRPGQFGAGKKTAKAW
ncbi:MAG: hypothetical protein KGI75_12560 [Rhizobiaceae bacterium]|nr:hypothetical protein [Rhizobiaceae bacterium]